MARSPRIFFDACLRSPQDSPLLRLLRLALSSHFHMLFVALLIPAPSQVPSSQRRAWASCHKSAVICASTAPRRPMQLTAADPQLNSVLLNHFFTQIVLCSIASVRFIFCGMHPSVLAFFFVRKFIIRVFTRLLCFGFSAAHTLQFLVRARAVSERQRQSLLNSSRFRAAHALLVVVQADKWVQHALPGQFLFNSLRTRVYAHYACGRMRAHIF